MELVILSTFAAAVILIAELLDLAVHERVDRSAAAPAGARRASVVGLPNGLASQPQPAAVGSELDRAA